MRKTLVVRNIKQPQQRESWDQRKQTLAKEILNVVPELDKDFIISKIERAHRSKENKYRTILPVLQSFQTGPFLNRLSAVSLKLQK